MNVWNFVDSWCLTANLSWVCLMNLLVSQRQAPWIDSIRRIDPAVDQSSDKTRFFLLAKIDFTRHLPGHNTPTMTLGFQCWGSDIRKRFSNYITHNSWIPFPGKVPQFKWRKTMGKLAPTDTEKLTRMVFKEHLNGCLFTSFPGWLQMLVVFLEAGTW